MRVPAVALQVVAAAKCKYAPVSVLVVAQEGMLPSAVMPCWLSALL
jgi:hypothetical protein